jgi:aryl-alcohol dehydrogenase-like predicted oxidoreductase
MGGIVVCGLSQEVASRRVAQAYDRGLNYFDCAPSYFNGEAESKLGEALKPYRSKIFLAEKTMHRDAKGAREELEHTLQRFHTDHVDLYQFHAVSSMDDVDKILAPGGAAETFFAARNEGMVRHLGFSSTSDLDHKRKAGKTMRGSSPYRSLRQVSDYDVRHLVH